MRMKAKDCFTFAAWGGALLLCAANVARAAEGPYGGTPAAIPGTVQAANYDTGGQGVGYSVTSINGSANSYRSDGVDLEVTTDTGGGYDLGWTSSGQWFRYTVNVAAAGAYAVTFRVAAESAISDAFHISNSSGTDLSGTVSVPDTGGWQTWTTVTATVTLPAGTQTLTVNQDTAGWNIHDVVFAAAEGPFGGTPAAIPGTVQAANYDTGGQGIGYNVSSVNGSANSYRPDGVDLEVTTDTGGGYDLGWTVAGQWFKYTVNVAAAGTYAVTFRVAAESAISDALHISNSSGTNLSGTVSVPDTGGWQDWTNVTATVTLPAGRQTLTVNQDTAGWNIHYLAFAAETTSCVVVPGAPTGLAASGTSGSGTTLSWTADTAPANCSIGSYTVLENGSEIGTATGTSFAVTGLSASTTYSFTVEANDSVGPSPASSALSVTTSTSSGGEGPYGGTPAAIPGKVLASNYDLGGQGVAYDVSSINGTGNSYRSDGVDLEATTDTGGGYDLGWTAAGQWFKYTVKVATAGTYTVTFRVAAESAVTDAFHLSNSSGTNLSGTVNVPNTGGWQTWTNVTATVTLPAGQQTLTFNQDNGGWNTNYFTFAAGTTGGGPRLVGYLPDYDGSYATFAQTLNFNKMTHLNFAFGNPPTCNGTCTASSNMAFSLGQSNADITTLVNAAHAAGVKVILSIGGGGGDQQIIQFYNAGLSAQLVASLNSYVTEFNLDGVDLDIEDPNNMGTPYATFAADLISTFHPQNKIVTAAVAEYLQSAMPTSTLLQFDFVNIMNYSSLSDAQTAMAYFSSLGEPSSRMVLGVPFFGSSNDGNTEETYATILAAYPGAGGENSVSGGSLDGGITLNYVGDAEMAQETQLGVQYGGIMIWELSQDAPPPNSLLTIIQNNL